MRRYLLCKGRPLVVLYSVLIFNGHPVPQFLQAQPLPICRQTQVQFQVLFYFSYVHIIQISNLQNFATPLSSLSPAQEYVVGGAVTTDSSCTVITQKRKKEEEREERNQHSLQHMILIYMTDCQTVEELYTSDIKFSNISSDRN